MPKRKQKDNALSKQKFHALLRKASQPVRKSEKEKS